MEISITCIMNKKDVILWGTGLPLREFTYSEDLAKILIFLLEEYNDPDDKVLVWPDLVYIEFISLILFMVFLIVWSILVAAPLEEPANPASTPNPSKAPWYFLGLQEMLVYFDPWLAGIVPRANPSGMDLSLPRGRPWGWPNRVWRSRTNRSGAWA